MVNVYYVISVGQIRSVVLCVIRAYVRMVGKAFISYTHHVAKAIAMRWMRRLLNSCENCAWKVDGMERNCFDNTVY